MRKPDWQTKDGQIKLYRADCLDLLPSIKSEAIVTDPPWNMNYFQNDNKPWPICMLNGLSYECGCASRFVMSRSGF